MSTEYKALATLSGHSLAVNSLAINSAGTLMASGGDDGQIIVWDITQPHKCAMLQKISDRFGRRGRITSITIPPASGSAEYPVETIIFGTETGYLSGWHSGNAGGSFEEIHGQAIFDVQVEVVACNCKGKVVVASYCGDVICFDMSNKCWEEVWRLKVDDAIPRAITFDVTGANFHLFVLKPGIRIFSLKIGEQCTFTTETGSFCDHRQLRAPVGYADISPDGERFLVDTICGAYEIYAVSSNSSSTLLDSGSPASPELILERPHELVRGKAMIKQGVFGENGRIAVCGSTDGRVFIYALTGSREGMELLTPRMIPAQILDHGTDNAIPTVTSISLPERHLIVSAPTQDNPPITIWARDRALNDAPVEASLVVKTSVAEKEETTQMLGYPPSLPFRSLVQREALGVLALLLVLGSAIVYSCSGCMNDILRASDCYCDQNYLR